MFGGGSVEGDGGLWMVKQGVQGEGSAVATLRDVRLFRCKRFEGYYPMIGRIGTFTKKGLFFVCVPIVLGVYTGREQGTKGTSYNKGKTGVKAYAFQC